MKSKKNCSGEKQICTHYFQYNPVSDKNYIYICVYIYDGLQVIVNYLPDLFCIFLFYLNFLVRNKSGIKRCKW